MKVRVCVDVVRSDQTQDRVLEKIVRTPLMPYALFHRFFEYDYLVNVLGGQDLMQKICECGAKLTDASIYKMSDGEIFAIVNVFIELIDIDIKYIVYIENARN